MVGPWTSNWLLSNSASATSFVGISACSAESLSPLPRASPLPLPQSQAAVASSSAARASSSSSSCWISCLVFTGTVTIATLVLQRAAQNIGRFRGGGDSQDSQGSQIIGGDSSSITFRTSERSDSSSKTTTITTTNMEQLSSISKKSVLALRQKHLSKSVSVSYLNSGGLMIMKGLGSKLYDENNQPYLDTRNNVCHVGHCHPKVVDAVKKQISLLNTNTRYLHPNAVILAERLTNLLPDPLEVVFFVNSGSEANDLALRLARAHTKSDNTIVVEGGYHGHTLQVLQVSPYKYSKGTEFPLLPKQGQHANYEQKTNTVSFPTPSHNIYQVPVPDMYRGRHRRRHHHYYSNRSVDEQGQEEESSRLGERYSQYVIEACEYYRTQHNEKVGALIIEGGMSVGGVILPPSSFLEGSVEAVRQAGGVWIADEVQTGFGRLGPGSSFWAFSHHYNNGSRSEHFSTPQHQQLIVPDIVTLGKPMGNGMAIGAVVTTRAVASSFEALGIEYFNTFGGNPVACAASLAMLDVLEEENLPQYAFEVGTYLRRQFEDMHCRWIGDVRGSGLFMGIELIRPDTQQNEDNLDGKVQISVPEPATAETSFICTILKDKHQILTSIDGLYDNVLVIKPPMVFSKDDADLFVNSFEMAIQELETLDGETLKDVGRTST